MKQSDLTRLKRVLLSDTMQLPSGVMKILKEDVFNTLSSYFIMEKEDFTVEIDADTSDGFKIKITAKAKEAKAVKILE